VHLNNAAPRDARHDKAVADTRARDVVPLSHNVIRCEGSHAEQVEAAVAGVVAGALLGRRTRRAEAGVAQGHRVDTAIAQVVGPATRWASRQPPTARRFLPHLPNHTRRAAARPQHVLDAVPWNAVPLSDHVTHRTRAQAAAVKQPVAAVVRRARTCRSTGRAKYRKDTLPTERGVREHVVGPTHRERWSSRARIHRNLNGCHVGNLKRNK